MRAALFFAFVLFALANAQFVDRIILDDFSVNQPQRVIIDTATTGDIPAGSTPAENGNVYDGSGSDCSVILGCSRDMRIRVTKSPSSELFTSLVSEPSLDSVLQFAGKWTIASPRETTSTFFIDYDGIDTVASNPDAAWRDLDRDGLGGVDLTDGGLALGFRFYAVSDLPATFTIVVYDMDGRESTGQVAFEPLPNTDYTRDDIDRDIFFTEFSGNAVFSRVGAVSIFITNTDAVDATIFQISIFGNPDPSPSPSPSPTPSRSQPASQSPSPTSVPSQSNTPAPSQSRTPAPSQSPSRTPSPSGPCIIFCQCPEFTCAILYDNPGSNNDIDFDFRPGQEVPDDSGSVIYITVSNPTISFSPLSPVTFTVPTVSFSPLSPVTFTVPTVSVPTVTFDFGSSSSSGALVASMLVAVVALLI